MDLVSINRFNPRRDANEADIVQALNKCGRKCLRLDAFDLLVLNPDKSLTMLEIKTRTGVPTVLQQTILDQGWPLKMVRTVEETLKAVGAIK